jgi:hypothetical protein
MKIMSKHRNEPTDLPASAPELVMSAELALLESIEAGYSDAD